MKKTTPIQKEARWMLAAAGMLLAGTVSAQNVGIGTSDSRS